MKQVFHIEKMSYAHVKSLAAANNIPFIGVPLVELRGKIKAATKSEYFEVETDQKGMVVAIINSTKEAAAATPTPNSLPPAKKTATVKEEKVAEPKAATEPKAKVPQKKDKQETKKPAKKEPAAKKPAKEKKVTEKKEEKAEDPKLAAAKKEYEELADKVVQLNEEFAKSKEKFHKEIEKARDAAKKAKQKFIQLGGNGGRGEKRNRWEVKAPKDLSEYPKTIQDIVHDKETNMSQKIRAIYEKGDKYTVDVTAHLVGIHRGYVLRVLGLKASEAE